MIAKNEQLNITAPLLHRLIDHDPAKLREQKSAKTIDIKTLYEHIRLNLEHLLNTRSKQLSWPGQLKELNRSAINYGTPDFTHSYYGNTQTQQQLCTEITTIIRRFEPRLTNINVAALESNVTQERTLKIRIDAAIDIAPSPVAAVFESTLDVVNHDFRVD